MDVWTVKNIVSTWEIAKRVRMQYIDKGFKTKIRKFDK